VTDSKDPAEDLRLRWLPTDRSVRHARALLAAEPTADVAVVPMFQPGKQYGIWTVGQLVSTVPGVVFIVHRGEQLRARSRCSELVVGAERRMRRRSRAAPG
jgi:hypothetical protein